LPIITSLIFYCTLLGSAVAGAAILREHALHPALVVPLVSILAGIAVLTLQRFAAFSESWRDYGHDLKVDMLHAIFSTGGTPALLELIAVGWLVVAAEWASTTIGVTLWPTHFPVAIQLGLALLVGDFGAYWLHRLGHRSAFFWRFHAMHHSSEKLYGVNSARNHPINVMTAYLASVGPLVLLGATGEVLLLMSIFTSVNGLIQHSNSDLRLGPLDWIVASPALHRRHHHVSIERSNSNFGSNLILWDIVFGTRALPDGEFNDEVGLPDMMFRSNFWQHLASPFRIAKLMRPARERVVSGVQRVLEETAPVLVVTEEAGV
jgi:sterol desaturase/sphingolipid hydroxylase (fatty acid hydroxylase superfamily)